MSAAFPDQPNDTASWPHCARLFPHVLAVIDHASKLMGDAHIVASLLDKAGRYLWSRAEFEQAKTMDERALAIREARLGPDHPDTVRIRKRLTAVVADLEHRSNR